MQNRLATLAATVAFAALAGCAATASAPLKTANGMLVDNAGMTLYTFDRDSAGAGKSACNGPCAAMWPPAMAMSGAKAMGDYSVIAREDGGQQWAYKGKPVYRFKDDTAPGDMKGENFRNVWHVARP